MEGAEALHTREREGKVIFYPENSGAIRYFRSRERKWKKRVEIVARPWMLHSHWPPPSELFFFVLCWDLWGTSLLLPGPVFNKGREKRRRRRCSNALDPDWCPPNKPSSQRSSSSLFSFSSAIFCAEERERGRQNARVFLDGYGSSALLLLPPLFHSRTVYIYIIKERAYNGWWGGIKNKTQILHN